MEVPYYRKIKLYYALNSRNEYTNIIFVPSNVINHICLLIFEIGIKKNYAISQKNFHLYLRV